MHLLFLTVMSLNSPGNLSAGYLAGMAIALFILAYLVYSLVRPDKF